MFYSRLDHQPRAGTTAVGILIQQMPIKREPHATCADANRGAIPAIRIARQRRTVNLLFTVDRVNPCITTK